MNIKKGDLVRVIAGKDKGQEGKVLFLDKKTNRVVVEGVNRIHRHTKPETAGGVGAGGIITKEAPIHVSNVTLLATVDGKKVPTRVASRRDDITKRRADGTTYPAKRSVRVSAKTKEEI